MSTAAVVAQQPTPRPHATAHRGGTDRARPAMATTARVRLAGAASQARADALAAAALEVFAEVERHCSRFDLASALAAANRAPDRWHRAPRVLVDAVAEAHAAYLQTDGRFDPRVLGVLQSLGYDRTLPFGEEPVRTAPTPNPPGAFGPWRPHVDRAREVIHLGGEPIDLGGIGKGLAVRWAAEQLAGQVATALVEAGGDLLALGDGPDGEGWLIGVDDPRPAPRPAHGRPEPTPPGPAAVLRLADRACATSSTALRRWTCGGRPAHHLIDPRTGRPAEGPLASVTVVADDPADAEVWAKTLLLQGAGAFEEAEGRGLAAYLQHDDGPRQATSSLRPYLIWERPHAG